MTIEVIKPLTVANNHIRSFQKTDSFKIKSPRSPSSPKNPCKVRLDRSLSFKSWETDEKKLGIIVSFKLSGFDNYGFSLTSPCQINDSPVPSISPRAKGELDAAAIKVQKVYKSYRTRRSLADCAVVVEELWWKSDNASSEHNSLSYLNVRKPETAVSRWARAGTRAAKVGKGLLKDNKAQKLALRHWLEAIDPRHRYGHNLRMYHNVWFRSESTQPFFYWLDIGEGKELNLEKCPRSMLQSQCIKYLGQKEREEYEIIVKNGKLVYKKSQVLLDTIDGSKWIFVLSTFRNLYVGQKIKGKFQHSSFLSGGATSAAGRLVAKNGILKAIWPYSGHYRPTEENFKEFISFLEEKHLDLTNVKRCSTDDDEYTTSENVNYNQADEVAEDQNESDIERGPKSDRSASDQISSSSSSSSSSFKYSPRLSCDWTSGAGARIRCVRDYPSELQFKALKQVNLSPRIDHSSSSSSSSLTDNMIKVPIPSPRPSSHMRLSPRLASIGFPSPRVSLTMPAKQEEMIPKP